jgi:LytS/YehU family sensor histidine kinase
LHSKENEQIANLIESIEKSDKPFNREEVLQKIYNFKIQNRLPIPARTVMSLLFIFGISTSIKVTQEWFKNEKQRKELENERLNAELSFLKSQVNPHFLFNTLNSIYSLANRKSEKSADAIVKLSNILRYMLYDTDNKMVYLKDEIQYLTDYIDLQKLRLYDNTHISFTIKGDIESKQIAPMLLVPFVENAFKHGIDNISDCYIDILLKVENSVLIFNVENSIPFASESAKDKSPGIGLNNVKRRLKLVYPDSHFLLIDQTIDSYSIKLNITLSDYELYNS